MGFTVSNEGAHKVLFIFDNKEDVDCILSSESWSFDKSLVVLQRYDKRTPLEELNFDKASFWVHEDTAFCTSYSLGTRFPMILEL